MQGTSLRASPRAVPGVHSAAVTLSLVFWRQRVWSASIVLACGWKVKMKNSCCDVSAWCLWVSEFEVRALLWSSDNTEVLIQSGRFLSKQMVPVCLCVTQMWVSVTGTVQSTSAAFNSSLSTCGVVYVEQFFFSFFSFFFIFFFFKSVSICTQFLQDQRSQMFSTGLPLFFIFFFIFYCLWLKWNVLPGFVSFTCYTLRKMWREDLEKSQETLHRGHQRQIWGKKGAKERNQSNNLQSGFITTLPSRVPKLRHKLSTRHFTQVTVARYGCVTWWVCRNSTLLFQSLK